MYRIISEQNLIQYSIFLDGFVIGKEAGAQSATVDGCGCLWQFRPFQGTNSSVPDPPLWWAGSISLSRLVLNVQGFVSCLHSSVASALLFMKTFLLCGSRCFTYSKRVSRSLSKDDLELCVLLPQFLECWDCRHVPLCYDFGVLSIKPRTWCTLGKQSTNSATHPFSSYLFIA